MSRMLAIALLNPPGQQHEALYMAATCQVFPRASAVWYLDTANDQVIDHLKWLDLAAGPGLQVRSLLAHQLGPPWHTPLQAGAWK